MRPCWLLLCGVALCGCLEDRPGWHPWLAADDIEGPLRPEVRSSLTAPPPDSLRVVTYNVHFAGDVPALLAALRSDAALGRADLLLLQEIESHPGETASRSAMIAEGLRMNHAYAPARMTDDGGTHGIALLSRFPISDVEVMELPFFELPWSSPPRIALAATLDLGGAVLRVINVHLDTRLNINQRLQQLEPVVATVSGPVLIGGDLNTNPYLWVDRGLPLLSLQAVGGLDPAQAIDDYMKASGFESPTATFGSTSNLPVLAPRLDSIYCRSLPVSDGGVAREVTTSDHLPVWVDLVWPPP